MNNQWSVIGPKYRVLDCTIRDGGLINDHQFSLEFVRAVYNANVSAGIDYMEIGYKNSRNMFSVETNGCWKFCQEEDLRRAVGENPSKIKLSCMIDAAKSDWKTDVLPKQQSPLDMIRVAFYDYHIEEALQMIDDAFNKGYEVSANLMAVTTVEEKTLDSILERLCKSPVSVFVIVDSFGFISLAQMEYLTRKYVAYASSVQKEVGVHAHNNMQLAYANTLTAARLGATRLDATIGGLGRGAGNCPMELLAGSINPSNYDLRPIYHCLENHVFPLREKIEWGPYPEFNMTGQNNVHPRAAIAARKNPDTRDRYTSFYDNLKGQSKAEN